MLLVVKPGGEGFVAGSATALALISVLFCTVRDIVTRFIPPRIPTMVVTLSTCSAVGLFAAAMIPFQGWAPATLTHVLYLFAASIVLVIGNFAMIQSFRGVEVSLISPFRYSVHGLGHPVEHHGVRRLARRRELDGNWADRWRRPLHVASRTRPPAHQDAGTRSGQRPALSADHSGRKDLLAKNCARSAHEP